MPIARMALTAPGPSSAVIRMAREDRREGEGQVDGAAQDLVGPAAPCSGPQAQRHADDQADHDRHHPDRDRVAGADHDARQRVAAQLVGAQPVQRARRLQLLWDGDGVRRIGRPGQAEQRHADEDDAERRGRGRSRDGANSRTIITPPLRPRVDHGIDHVDQEIDRDDDGGQQHHHVLDHDQVALGDRLEGQPAQAGQGEDVLDHHRAGHQEAELQADDGGDRDQGVAQHVAAQHPALRQALGAGGADIVLAQRLQHRRAGDAGQDRRLGQGQGQRPAGPARAAPGPSRRTQPGKPPAPNQPSCSANSQDQHDADPEVGHGEAELAEPPSRPSRRPGCARRGQHAERQGQRGRQQQGQQRQRQRSPPAGRRSASPPAARRCSWCRDRRSAAPPTQAR